MLNPRTFVLPDKQIKKIAEAVTSGSVNKLNANTEYLVTYRLTGLAAPSYDDFMAEAVTAFSDSTQEIIEADAEIDVYMMALANPLTAESGKVAVWL